MNSIFASLVLIIASVSFASPGKLNYNCFSIDDNEPYGLEKMKIVVSSKTQIKVQMDLLKLVNETYLVNPKYVGKTESMKNFLQYNVTNPDYSAYGEGPVNPLFVEKDLLTGGYQLKKGGTGAIVKTTGHGYSWARYLCVLQ